MAALKSNAPGHVPGSYRFCITEHTQPHGKESQMLLLQGGIFADLPFMMVEIQVQRWQIQLAARKFCMANYQDGSLQVCILSCCVTLVLMH